MLVLCVSFVFGFVLLFGEFGVMLMVYLFGFVIVLIVVIG